MAANQELIAYLDRRFDETSEQIAALRQETTEQIVGLRQEIDQRFEQVDQRLEQVDQRLEQVDQRLEQVDQRLEQVDQRFEQVDQRFEQVDQRLTSVEDETRHAHIVAESLRSDLQAVAEGVATVDAKLDRHIEDNAREFRETRAMVHVSYAQLEERVSALEVVQAGGRG